MLPWSLFAFLLGIALAHYFRALILVPATMLVVGMALFSGSGSATPIILGGITVAFCLQFGFVLGSMICDTVEDQFFALWRQFVADV